MKNPLKKMYSRDGQDRLLPKLSLFVFDRSRTAAVIWLCLTIFGIVSYTTLLKREGFPSINIPFSVAAGAYLVNDPAKVDTEVAKPISDIALKDDRVKSVQAQAQGNFYNVFIQYDENVNADEAGKEIAKRVADANVLPKEATVKFETPKIGFNERGDDAIISVYAKDGTASTDELVVEGDKLAAYIKDKKFPEIESISVVDPYVEGADPATGEVVRSQTKFDKYGVRQGSTNAFFDSVAVGYMQKDGTDVITVNDEVEKALAAYNRENSDSPYQAVVSATYANDIKDQISGLQKALLEGLLAVLVVGSIVIAIRASLVTVIAMLTVLSITLGVLFAAGYTLNTITLFSLILCLGLIVDDTIIMVEALDAQRRRRKDARETVHVATKKVSRAMVAATLTAAMSFAPLLFIGGILGSFIRAIPVTVITSLLVSLCVALVFIPLFARYLLLGKKQMGAKNVHEPAAGIEAKVAAFIGKPMLWARHSKKKLFGVGITAVLIGFLFIGTAGFLFQKVTFNIFPPSKDSNGLMISLSFEPGTTLEEARKIADNAHGVIGDRVGKEFKSASYYQGGSSRDAILYVYLTSLHKRDITAPELVDQLNEDFKNFKGARVESRQMDIGPPASSFTTQIQTDNREAAFRLAEDLEAFLSKTELKRPSGEIAKITETSISDPGTYSRADGKSFISVTANFDADDTTTLVTLGQDAVKKEFNASKLQSYGLEKDALNFDIGQEEENQDSFKSLAMAFPILLLAIYLLLSIQFRSLLQPLLIFMAIPFSLLGITLGLYLTDNAFSFFAMLGFFALIGLSIKNTILLTDYANQLRHSGMPVVDAAVGALSERFRPLIATSFTAVVSLIPLALSDPFWEGLTVVLICGLLSSTFMVLTVFPYYYLGAEYLRLRVSRKAGVLWVVLTVLLCVLLGSLKAPSVTFLLVPFVVMAGLMYWGKHRRNRRAAA